MGKFPLTPYFDSLIDDFGIWQHTDGKVILREEGYALDDATRGLLLTLALNRKDQSEVLLSYIKKSQIDIGFNGFSKSNRDFIPVVASDDATGQVIWAVGYAISKKFHVEESIRLIKAAAKYLDKTEHVRGYAYALLGAVYVDKELAEFYYKKLLTFFENTSKDWLWPEDIMTYGNGIMPYAFLRYGLLYGDKSAIKLGRKILLFLEKCCTNGRQRGPIGNDKWLSREAKIASEYSQQPIDAAYMIWAWLAAYQISGNASDKNKSELWMKWFEGDNIAQTKMYDPKDMRCFDGIDPLGVHYHSGAESNICFLLSKYMLANKETI